MLSVRLLLVFIVTSSAEWGNGRTDLCSGHWGPQQWFGDSLVICYFLIVEYLAETLSSSAKLFK